MRRESKKAMLSALVLTLVGFIGFAPVQLGKSLSTVAQASEWSEAVLTQVIGLHGKEGQKEAIGPIAIQLDNATVLPLDPKARITVIYDCQLMPDGCRLELLPGG